MIRRSDSAKETVLKIVRDQPEDSSLDEILRELAMHRMIERGTSDVDAGRTISHEDMVKRAESWLK